jgi:hypothetical protein
MAAGNYHRLVRQSKSDALLAPPAAAPRSASRPNGFSRDALRELSSLRTDRRHARRQNERCWQFGHELLMIVPPEGLAIL